MLKICQATSLEHIALSRVLFEEYAKWLGVDLCFQGFAAELASLPGRYAPPGGRLLLALAGAEAAGCVALRAVTETVGEMKRLYVRPAFRGQHLGRLLALQILAEARSVGYRTIRLDTLPRMQTAIQLYEAVGFVRCGAYYDTPLADTVFMELHL